MTVPTNNPLLKKDCNIDGNDRNNEDGKNIIPVPSDNVNPNIRVTDTHNYFDYRNKSDGYPPFFYPKPLKENLLSKVLAAAVGCCGHIPVKVVESKSRTKSDPFTKRGMPFKLHCIHLVSSVLKINFLIITKERRGFPRRSVRMVLQLAVWNDIGE
ncbi:hypothetical protein [Laceyella putida]|uniref:Uncharacterized protein n=1 Tax=Laceyella putida TaxID=110101 RepID=A0ABW2RL38_9BACL